MQNAEHLGRAISGNRMSWPVRLPLRGRAACRAPARRIGIGHARSLRRGAGVPGYRRHPWRGGAVLCWLPDFVCVCVWVCRRSALHPAKGAAAHPWNPLPGALPLGSPIRLQLRARLSAKGPCGTQAGKTLGAALLPAVCCCPLSTCWRGVAGYAGRGEVSIGTKCCGVR